MDNEYLKNIANSLHIDEGLGDRILSRGSSGLQRLQSLVGGEFSDPNYSKVNSLFNGFVKKITSLLKDFAEGPHSIGNRLEQMKPAITKEQLDSVNQLKDLYDLIVPPMFRQHQVKHSIFSPRASRSQLTEMLKEGIFSREMALNKALFSNNPDKIIKAYVGELKKEYNGFLKDAIKVTGAPKDYVKRIVGNLNKKWSPVLNKVEQVSNSLPSTSTVNVNQPDSQSPSQGTTIPTIPTQAKGYSTSPESKEQSNVNDFASIIERVIDIIIETVRSDVERAEKFISSDPSKQKTLPTDWEQPPITKEPKKVAEAQDDTEKGVGDKDEVGVDEEPGEDQITGEFLYDFQSLYDKQRNFSIEVKPPNEKMNLFKLKSNNQLKKIDVVWNNRSHENDIYVKHTSVRIEKTIGEDGQEKTIIKPIEKTEQSLLFKFWDDQVNPRNPETKNFSVEMLLSQANPAAIKIIEVADKSILARLVNKKEPLLRALYATTHRKAMEFKRKPFQLTYDEQGNVFRVRKDGSKVPISKEELKSRLNSKDPKERERWRSSLEKVDYFSKFPEETLDKSITVDEVPAALDAVKALQTLGQKSIQSIKLVQNAIDDLGTDATTQDYIKHALGSIKSNASTVSTPVSAPVTAPVSVPVSSEPTSPISTDHPKPEVAPSKSTERDLGKAAWDDKGVITWEKPDGKVVKLTPKQFKNMKSPRLELLLKKQGYFDKFPESLKECFYSEIVNPFDSSNFL